MPKKVEIDWEAYLYSLSEQNDIDRAVEEMASMSCRDLYNMPSYTNAANYLINRPTNHAMHGAITNYVVNPVDIIKDTLIDGVQYYKIEDWQHIRKEEFVWRVEEDHFTEEIIIIVICYPIDGGKQYYWESYVSIPSLNNTNTCLYTQYQTTSKDDEATYDRLTPIFSIELPYMPYVSCKWNHGISILESPKAAIIRLEAVSRVIATENTERRGMALYITGIDNPDSIKKAPRRFGRNVHTLPTGAAFAFPNSDTAGVQLLSQEPIDLWRGIEKSTGVVSTETLSTLSGISRAIAMKPLNDLAEDIRVTFNNFLISIYNQIKFQPGTPEPTISYKPLDIIPPFEDNTKFVEVLDKALENNAISEAEWIQKIRYILDLDSNQ